MFLSLSAGLSLLSAVLLVLSFPCGNLGLLAWVGLAPLLAAIFLVSPGRAFVFSMTFGMVFMVGIFSWIFHVRQMTHLHHGLLALYLGAYYGVFGFMVSLLARRVSPAWALSCAPFLWVSLEYFRSNFSFLALPWAWLAHSQYQFIAVIQLASLAGTYAISFLLVLVNTALAAHLISWLSTREGWEGLSRISWRIRFALTSCALGSVAATLVYGYSILDAPVQGEPLKIAVVQGNIEQAKKWDPQHAKEIMSIYSGLTLEAAKDQPDLIVWPETSTPASVVVNPRMPLELQQLANEAKTNLLVGSAHPAKFRKEEGQKERHANSAFLYSHGQRKTPQQRYDKILLFPFGEYLPYPDTIPWKLIGISGPGSYRAGTEFSLFQLSGVHFAVTICWENLFPQLPREFVKRGAQVILNITNEARFGKTAAPYQFLAMNVFRAVENRVYVVRCANTGVSCFIDPSGKILDRVTDAAGQETFARGFLTASVVPHRALSAYTRNGDWFPLLTIGVSLVAVTAAAMRCIVSRTR